MSASLRKTSAASDYTFVPAGMSDKRSPCPALNALANHGYLPRRGTQITFTRLLHAVKAVYNLSLPLALLLTVVGFLTCAKFSAYTFVPAPMWWLPMAALSVLDPEFSRPLRARVEQNRPRRLPRALIRCSLARAITRPARRLPQHRARIPHPNAEAGLTLGELTEVHVARERSLPRPLGNVHEQIAVGECALGWLVMRNPATGIIDLDTLEQWFGEERLPEGWWDSRRPVKPVGLILARKMAGEVQRLAKQL
ncbi:hypothetical protein B0H13DRAFT_2570113 [Mycena leptocephala]|nr:hypothetical protein B0H13DRAFT_2570113 [Mycena leptocephala]